VYVVLDTLTRRGITQEGVGSCRLYIDLPERVRESIHDPPQVNWIQSPRPWNHGEWR
jgi:hypothetical protein